MRHFCPISGLHWSSPFLTECAPMNQPHPIFNLTYKQLVTVLDAHTTAKSDFNSPDYVASHYLLGIAMLNQLPVTFACAVDFERAHTTVISNWHKILYYFTKLQVLPEHSYPEYRVTHDNRTLFNIRDYLDLLQEHLTTRARIAKQLARDTQIARKEAILTRLLNTYSTQGQARLAKILPDWVSLVYPMPTGDTTLESGETIPLAEAWQDIIRQCVLANYKHLLVRYRITDVRELRDELEAELELGTPYASYVLRSLRRGIKVLEEFTSRPKVFTLEALDCDSQAEREEVHNAAIGVRSRIRDILNNRRTVRSTGGQS